MYVHVLGNVDLPLAITQTCQQLVDLVGESPCLLCNVISVGIKIYNYLLCVDCPGGGEIHQPACIQPNFPQTGKTCTIL